MKTREELSALSVDELRRMAREELRALRMIDNRPVKQQTAPVFVTSLGKAYLIDCLLAGKTFPTATEQTEPIEAAPAPEPTEDIPTPTEATHSAANAIFDALATLAKTTITIDTVKELVTAEVKRLIPRAIEIKTEHATKTIQDRTHKDFELCLRIVSAGVPLYLHGPAGTGKTHMAHQIANALDLNFWPYSCDESTQRFDLTGYNDAHGQYVEGVLYRPLVDGGLLLLDEIDRSGPALTVLNSALANGYTHFPNGTVQKHPRFYAIGAGNTKATGPDGQYTSANRQDAATFDRFAFLHFTHDEALERHVAGLDAPAPAPFKPAKPLDPEMWLDRVKAIRKAVETTKTTAIVSQRVTIYGLRLMAAGIDPKTTENLLVWNKMSDDTANRVKKAITV